MTKTATRAHRVFEMKTLAVDAANGETVVCFAEAEGDLVMLTMPQSAAARLYRGLAASPIKDAKDPDGNPENARAVSVADKYIGRDGGEPRPRS